MIKYKEILGLHNQEEELTEEIINQAYEEKKSKIVLGSPDDKTQLYLLNEARSNLMFALVTDQFEKKNETILNKLREKKKLILNEALNTDYEHITREAIKEYADLRLEFTQAQQDKVRKRIDSYYFDLPLAIDNHCKLTPNDLLRVIEHLDPKLIERVFESLEKRTDKIHMDEEIIKNILWSIDFLPHNLHFDREIKEKLIVRFLNLAIKNQASFTETLLREMCNNKSVTMKAWDLMASGMLACNASISYDTLDAFSKKSHLINFYGSESSKALSLCTRRKLIDVYLKSCKKFTDNESHLLMTYGDYDKYEIAQIQDEVNSRNSTIESNPMTAQAALMRLTSAIHSKRLSVIPELCAILENSQDKVFIREELIIDAIKLTANGSLLDKANGLRIIKLASQHETRITPTVLQEMVLLNTLPEDSMFEAVLDGMLKCKSKLAILRLEDLYKEISNRSPQQERTNLKDKLLEYSLRFYLNENEYDVEKNIILLEERLKITGSKLLHKARTIFERLSIQAHSLTKNTTDVFSNNLDPISKQIKDLSIAIHEGIFNKTIIKNLCSALNECQETVSIPEQLVLDSIHALNVLEDKDYNLRRKECFAVIELAINKKTSFTENTLLALLEFRGPEGDFIQKDIIYHQLFEKIAEDMESCNAKLSSSTLARCLQHPALTYSEKLINQFTQLATPAPEKAQTIEPKQQPSRPCSSPHFKKNTFFPILPENSSKKDQPLALPLFKKLATKFGLTITFAFFSDWFKKLTQSNDSKHNERKRRYTV